MLPKRELKELEELLEGEAAVVAIGSGEGRGAAIVYAESALEELRGLMAVLGVAVQLLARESVPKVFIVEAVKELLKADSALVVVERYRRS